MYSPSGLLGRFWIVDATVVRRDLRVRDRPVHVRAVAARRLEVDVAHPGGRTPPEVRLAADGMTTRPFPFRARRRRVGDAVFPHAGVRRVLALDVVVAV